MGTLKLTLLETIMEKLSSAKWTCILLWQPLLDAFFMIAMFAFECLDHLNLFEFFMTDDTNTSHVFLLFAKPTNVDRIFQSLCL